MKKLWILTFIFLSFILTAFGQFGFIPNFEGDLYRRDLTNPANAILVGITIGQIGASDFDLNGQLYAISNNDNGLYSIDTTTAAATLIAILVPASGHMWTGMACDPTDGNIYFCSTDGDSGLLYTFNESTGITLIGPINAVDPSVVGIAFDDSGQMYGIMLVRKFYLIDKTTGDGVLIGELNSAVSGLPYHGLDFDPLTQTMFMVSYNAFTFDNELWTVDLATGANTLVGSVGLWTGTIAVVPMESLMASFTSDMTIVCPDDSIYYFDTSTGGPANWSWTFEGGTPETSDEQNPVVVYGSSGEYDVTLEVSDGTNTDILLNENYITVYESPEPEISGMTEPCEGDIETYFTSNNPGNTYDWVVEGGTIVSGTGTNEISVEWTNFGPGLIVLTEGNEFCTSTTEPLEVYILVCDAIGEHSSHSSWLSPNPAVDEIRLKLIGLNGINLKIIDISGREVLHQMLQNQKLDFPVVNISSLPEGFYFLHVSTIEGKVYSGKFVKIE